MKNRLTGLLTLAFVFAMLAACGTTTKNTDPSASPSAVVTEMLPGENGTVTDGDGILGNGDDKIPDEKATTLPEKDKDADDKTGTELPESDDGTAVKP